MTEEQAQRVLAECIAASAALDAIAALAQDELSDEERERVKLAVGKTQSCMFDEIIEPIYFKHRALKPKA